MHIFPRIKFKIASRLGRRRFVFENGFVIEKQKMFYGPVPFYYHVYCDNRTVGINFRNFDSAYLFMTIKSGLLITLGKTNLVRTAI